ncbi:MAG: hypothetical protein D8H91_10165 [Alloprevotella sp.]|nr:MAG: hypothetical protein D8H91_10165 [Alloprevotella sp.]
METKKTIEAFGLTFERIDDKSGIRYQARVSNVEENVNDVKGVLLHVMGKAIEAEPMAVSYTYGIAVQIADEYDGYLYPAIAISEPAEDVAEYLEDSYTEVARVLGDGTEIRYGVPYRTGLPCEKDWEDWD